MRRFFLEDIDEATERAELSGDEFSHLKRVLRLGPGDEVSVFNGRGLELEARIEAVGGRSARLVVTGRAGTERESPLEIFLLQALLKGDRPEFIVQKATELGVKGVCFYSTERTVSKVSAENAGRKVARWKKAAIEAAKQCGRAVLPEITLEPDLKAAASACRAGLRLLLWEKDGARSLRELLSGERPSGAAIIVGPEGSLSDDDAAAAVRAGFVKVSLGPRTLRAETAAIAAAAAVQFAFGDLN